MCDRIVPPAYGDTGDHRADESNYSPWHLQLLPWLVDERSAFLIGRGNCVLKRSHHIPGKLERENPGQEG